MDKRHDSLQPVDAASYDYLVCPGGSDIRATASQLPIEPTCLSTGCSELQPSIEISWTPQSHIRFDAISTKNLEEGATSFLPFTLLDLIMAPSFSAPRELLWYHQLQKETRHLLERVKRQQAEVESVRKELSVSEGQKKELQETVSQLEANQVTSAARKREDFEREKQLLKRISDLESSVAALKRANENQPLDEVTRRLQSLDDRIVHVEKHQTTTLHDKGDTAHLQMRLEKLEKAHCENMTRNAYYGALETVQQRTADTGPALEDLGAFDPVRKEKIVAERSKEVAGDDGQVSNKRAHPILVQKRRRPEREKRIPFRPTPPDMMW